MHLLEIQPPEIVPPEELVLRIASGAGRVRGATQPATAVSCAPPTTNRVMMWQTFIPMWTAAYGAAQQGRQRKPAQRAGPDSSTTRLLTSRYSGVPRGASSR